MITPILHNMCLYEIAWQEVKALAHLEAIKHTQHSLV
jgi:hypothetical protein